MGKIKPDLAAPGVGVSTVNGPYSGGSMAAALTAGAVAQMFQWCVYENNYRRISGRGIRSFLNRTVNGPYSGGSMAAALTAGAVAQMFQWCVYENNYRRISGRGIRSFLNRGAQRQEQGEYPSRLSGRGIRSFLNRGAQRQEQGEYPSRLRGYGRLDMRRTFDEIAGNYTE